MSRSGRYISVTIRGMRAPNEFIVSKKKCVSEERIEAIELELIGDWYKRRHERVPGWKPRLNEEVMVFDPESEYNCCRGFVYGIGEGSGMERVLYEVYLYDHFIFRKIRKEFVYSLKENFKELAPRSFILRIPGIVPSKLISTNGMGINKPCREQYEGGNAWTDADVDVANKWVADLLEQGREIRCSVIKERNRVITIGDLFPVESQSLANQSYTDYLCQQKVAISSGQQYQEDINTVDHSENSVNTSSQAGNELRLTGAEASQSEVVGMNRGPQSPAADESDWNSLVNTEVCVKNDPDARIENAKTIRMSDSLLQGKSKDLMARSENAKLNGSGKTTSCVASSNKDPPAKNRDLFKKVYDPDKCFENVYSSVPPERSSVLESAHRSKDTVSFNEARIYDSWFVPGAKSDTSKPKCGGESRQNIATNDLCSTQAASPNVRISSKSLQSTERKVVAANGHPNSKPVLVDTKSRAQKEFYQKAQTSPANPNNVQQSNGSRFGRGDHDKTNPFFPNRCKLVTNASVAKVPQVNEQSESSGSGAFAPVNKLTNQNAINITSTTGHSATKRDRTGCNVRTTAIVPSLQSPCNPSPVSLSNSHVYGHNAVEHASLGIRDPSSEDVSDGVANKLVRNGCRPSKPFVCVLPSWSEVKIQVVKKCEDTPVSPPRSLSTRGARQGNSIQRQARENPFVINESKNVGLVSNELTSSQNGGTLSMTYMDKFERNGIKSPSSSSATDRSQLSATSSIISSEDGRCQGKNAPSEASSVQLSKNLSHPDSSSASFRQSPFTNNSVVDKRGEAQKGMIQSKVNDAVMKICEHSLAKSSLESQSVTDLEMKAGIKSESQRIVAPSCASDKENQSELKNVRAPQEKSTPGGASCDIWNDISGGPADVQIQTSANSCESSGYHIAAHSFDPDFLLKMIRGKVFVYGKSPVQPYSSINEFPYLNMITKAIENNNLFKNFNSMQKNAVPNILRGRNVFLVHNKCTGKSSAYMVPIVAKIMQDGKKMCKYARTGPFAIFLAGNMTKGTTLAANLTTLLSSVSVQDVRGEFITQNDQATKQKLKNGCDIIISTLECLIEMIEMDMPYFSYERLMYLVVDDGDICASEKSKLKDLVKLLKNVQHGLTSMGPRECPFQIIFVATSWTPEMKSASRIVDDPVLVLGQLQAIAFADIKTAVEYTETEEDKLQKFLELFGAIIENPKANNRVIIVCRNNENVQLVKQEICKKFQLTVQAYGHSTDADRTTDPGHIYGIRQKWLDSTSVEVIACTDAVIGELEITNALHLIHYDSAESLHLFSKRFSTMWTWFRSEDDRKTLSELVLLKSWLFLTSKEENLLEVVTRLKEFDCTIPSGLDEHYKKLVKAAEMEKKLCCGFLQVGFCDKSDVTKCTQRHFVLPRDITEGSMVPASGQVEVRIFHTYSVGCYWAQLVSHYQYEDGKMKKVYDYEKELQRRSEFLKAFYEDEKNKKQLSSFERDRYVAAWDPSTNTYFRAQIDSVLLMNRFSVVRVFCIDRGHYMSKSEERPQLYELPEGYGDSMPSIAVELILANMKPPFGERDFIPADKTKAAKIFGSEITLVGRICLAMGQRIWVDQLVEMDRNEAGKLYQKRSLRPELFKLKYAENNPQHMSILYDSCERVGLCCAKYENLRPADLGVEYTKYFHCKNERIQWAHLPLYNENNIESVVVLWTSYVREMDGVIFCNQEKFSDQLNELHTEMNREIELLRKKGKFPALKDLRSYFEEGVVVAVKDPNRSEHEGSDKIWKRAVITAVHRNEKMAEDLYDVFLVDVGETISCELRLAELLPVPKTFVNKLPFQAVALRLDHVLPSGDYKSWTSAAIDHIYRSVFPPPDEYSALINVAAISKEETVDDPYCGYNKYNSFIILGELELGEKLVLENVAVYAEGAEERVKSLKARLLKTVNSAVDSCLDRTETDEPDSSDLEDSEGNPVSTTGLPDEDSNRWDIYVPDDYGYDDLKPVLGENLVSKLTTKHVPEIMTSAGARASSEPEPGYNSNAENPVVSHTLPSDVARGETDLISSKQTSLKPPTTIWRQTDKEIALRLDITDVKSYELELKEDKKTLRFETVQPPGYGFEIKLYQRVEPSPIEVTLLGACIRIRLIKRLPDSSWDRLTPEKRRWIKRDTSCIPSDSDNEDSSEDDDDFPISPRRPKGKVQKRRKGEYFDVKYGSDESTSSEDDRNAELEDMLE